MEEQQHQQAFGEHIGISENCREDIRLIKDNSPYREDLQLYYDDADRFTDLAWKLLSRYIANNTHLEVVELSACHITDEIMTFLFSELAGSTSLKQLAISSNSFGIDGVRCVIPFLQNSPHLSALYLGSNRNINSECFEILVSALNGTSVKELYIGYCNITDISALDTYNLPNLRELILNGNYIGREGCITISNLLQKEGSTLTEIFLIGNTGVEDEGMEILAISIKHNTTLKILHLSNSGNTEKGCKVFLKLLVDISSIENTYNSNHTLTECSLTRDNNEIQSLINSVCNMNRINRNPGRAKVIWSQLNSLTRKRLCELQGIEYSTNKIFADIEPVLLPRILALIGDRHGQSELYTALIPTAPDLLSYIDRKAMLNDVLVKNAARATSLYKEYKEKAAECQAEYERKMASLETEYSYQTSRLTTHNVEVNNRLELIDLGDKKQSSSGGKGEENEETSTSSSKKQRIS